MLNPFIQIQLFQYIQHIDVNYMMYYNYIIMKTLQLTSDNDSVIRTQITLTQNIKKLVEDHARDQGESLSEYLRKAAMVRLLVENNDQIDLKKLAGRVIGSVDLKKHPEWRNEKEVQKWVRNLRSEW